MRSGGHGIPSYSSGDGVLLSDLSAMKQIAISQDRRSARVQPGVTNGELVVALDAEGLATTTGICASVSMGGSTFGGGIDWLTGRFGATVDNVLAFEVVAAEGAIITASVHEHPPGLPPGRQAGHLAALHMGVVGEHQHPAAAALPLGDEGEVIGHQRVADAQQLGLTRPPREGGVEAQQLARHRRVQQRLRVLPRALVVVQLKPAGAQLADQVLGRRPQRRGLRRAAW